jgi:hypothetical protein
MGELNDPIFKTIVDFLKDEVNSCRFHFENRLKFFKEQFIRLNRTLNSETLKKNQLSTLKKESSS